ncbi:glycosyltransferase [Candidatus Woesearchaeota archaeon]|nr:glycosyltransferase [Candidatus Woesearchaeota archaeon]MBT3537403.1 glycosyltransferase [Candidatus Woesearchaeota archaeon]MBT4697072.1 glycosyltransferase [Candidatus Woesearchaeota archaeon]MBT4717517.1 glycosyltransferase [Candidatus Woesearchaeota archaeon]MBT7106287.1 glycosyltransferase [Candidatus Woesearchaeota archaeon]
MNIWFNVLMYLVWFLATFYSVYFFLTIAVYRKDLFEKRKLPRSFRPRVTFLIPAYNEAKSIADSLKSMKKVTYKNIEFIVLNDGSKDDTSKIVRENIKGDDRFSFIDNKENKGKAGVLNQGIKICTGDFVACMDADSVVEPNIVQKVIPYFLDEKTGAVTVSVEVKNPKSFLQKAMAVEFAIGLSLFLKIFSYLKCVFVTPGPFSMYRKSMLNEIGGYDETNITEDHEIAFRVNKSKYNIENCIDARVYTILPRTFKQLYVQRRRWYSGAIQTFMKHRKMMFKKESGFFGVYIPFHYTLIILGLFTFLASIYLSISRFIREILYYQYTGFNFFDHFSLSLDPLMYGRVNLLGTSLVAAAMILMIVGIIVTRRKFRNYNLGLIGFPLLFILYQVYWGSAIWNAINNKKVKWR